QYASPRIQQGPSEDDAMRIFAPVSALLEDYNRVISKNGSIAVATGYRSVARRLLDRLEVVFNRNISAEHCTCVICTSMSHAQLSDEEDTGVSWGEILEFVSGRRELPQWPPFSIDPRAPGLGIHGMDPSSQTPMQKLDVDIPAEFREHYMRQNKKTKSSVQNWLASQPDFPSSPPQQVDDDTLAFAITTHLDPSKRHAFIALINDLDYIPDSRAPTPAPETDTVSDMLQKTALALQRLYRLPSFPRKGECGVYLVNNRHLHSMLATLAAISPGEWEILTSGRFDGFLWSGAETSNTPFPPSASTFNSPAASRGPTPFPPNSRTTTPFPNGLPSRGTTPFSTGFPSRGPTPAPGGPAPVQMDEETEIAVLAEVEREIYLGMEALEDAFEALHCKAEAVRTALRSRSAGLSMAAQARRGSGAEDVGVRMGTPASGLGVAGWENESEVGWLGEGSELMPDDSASNISYTRRRKKRLERRTPAPVEEEDETSEIGRGGSAAGGGGGGGVGGWRR
ncbi:hypothetical protein LTR66_015665, partial [Elasticomyces elasticus]